MTTATDTPRTRPTDADQPSRHVPIGSYTDDPAANVRHSADVADMMADRSRGSAERSAASAATALNALRLAEIAAGKAALAADRANTGSRIMADEILSVVGLLAIAALVEILCAVTIYALAKPIFAAVDSPEYIQQPLHWTAPPAGFGATPGAPLGVRP
ncbi:hypothetical protein [Mycobacterium paraintracellulare]|uniref:hypothetical protein n=1 Tax=Mycobacterium paraintracellulare TaxID=1138383 RepID=UPI00192942B0|nr:hypothetical protein [Mycobacterium paraintracellulare]BCP14003.1 hypothetical protein MINTM021_09120 [Mycobacterium paraintracellulare]